VSRLAANRVATCPFRKSYPDVLVVQPGQDSMGPYRWTARPSGASLPNAKCVRRLIVIRRIRSKNAPQVRLTKNPLSFSEIISGVAMMQSRQNGRGGNCIRIVGSRDPAAHLCAAINACAIYYNRRYTKSELAAGAPRLRSACAPLSSHRNIGRIVSHVLVGGLHHQYVRI